MVREGTAVAIKKSAGERVFDVFNSAFMVFLMLITIYPFAYVVFASVSDPTEFMAYHGILWRPVGFTLEGYRLVLDNPAIITGYMNTIFIVIAGTTLNVIITALFAYVLSRKNLYWRNTMMFMVVFTMFFSGGLIPSYLVVKGVGLYGSRWALIIPSLIGTWNLIIMRTSFQSIPDSLEESAKMDGASDFTVLFKIILPLSMPVIAVMILFYGVGHWNSWFSAMIYLKDRAAFPLQLVLREILINSSTENMTMEYVTGQRMALTVIIKYATVMVATVPILILYPFLQKYFVKGVMIGAIKG